MSDEFIDLHARALGHKGLYVWIWLQRLAISESSYPTSSDIQKLTGLSEKIVEDAWEYLYEVRELNNFDMTRLHPEPAGPWWSDEVDPESSSGAS